MGCSSEVSMKFGRNSTTEKSVSFPQVDGLNDMHVRIHDLKAVFRHTMRLRLLCCASQRMCSIAIFHASCRDLPRMSPVACRVAPLPEWVAYLSETGGRRRGPPAPTTRGLPRQRSGRLWASLASAECGTTARPTLGADERFPGETWPYPLGPGPCRLCSSPTGCAGSLNTSGWRS